MSTGPHDIAAAEARIHAARARLMGTLGEVQQRLRPSHLAQDAVESAAQGVATIARRSAEAVRTRPLAVAAFAGTVGLVMARGWIAGIVTGRRRNETAADPEGLKRKHETHAKHAKHAKKGHGK